MRNCKVYRISSTPSRDDVTKSEKDHRNCVRPLGTLAVVQHFLSSKIDFDAPVGDFPKNKPKRRKEDRCKD